MSFFNSRKDPGSLLHDRSFWPILNLNVFNSSFRSDITYVTDTISRRRKSRNRQETGFNDTVSCFEFGDNPMRRNMHPMPAIPDASPEQQIFETFDLPLRKKEEERIQFHRAPFPSARLDNDENRNDKKSKEKIKM